MTIVQNMSQYLPENYVAEPRVHLGALYEIDVSAYQHDSVAAHISRILNGSANVAWAAPQPTMIADADVSEQYSYEVLVYDLNLNRQLVAAVEIVSPANKDRPESRRAFLAKCSALLQQRVCVSIIDLVTTRKFNLCAELLAQTEHFEPGFQPDSPTTYAVTCRGRKVAQRPRFETWAYPLVVGQALPTLPLWLSEELSVPLELELSYEDACRALRIF